MQDESGRLITIFGGSGFVGRHVVRALARRGWRIRVAVRRPDLAFHLQPLGNVGQISAVQANLRYPASIKAALQGADAAINLVGIMTASGRQTFEGVQAFGGRAVAKAVAEAGITNFVHMSGIGADPGAESVKARTAGEAEAAVRTLVPSAVITRASVIFGPDDSFLNRFAAMAQTSPVLPLIGDGSVAFQPVHVGDVAEAIARAVEGRAQPGATYELGGPEVKSYRQILDYVCEETGRKRLLAPLPGPLAKAVAFGTELASMLSMGLFPKEFVLTRDQLLLLKHDNVVSPEAVSEGRTLEGLGIRPTTLEAIAPSYLVRYRKSGQFGQRLA